MKITTRIVCITAQVALLAVLALPASAQTYGAHGAGFIQSDTNAYIPSYQPGIVRGSNYGAGFVSSPLLVIDRFPHDSRFRGYQGLLGGGGGYGSGFYPSPAPWGPFGYNIGFAFSNLF